MWNTANEILIRRSEDVKNRKGICNHANLLTGKLFCTECGLPYYRRESKDKAGNVNSKWVCSGKIKNGKESCDSLPIYENEIKSILFEVFRETKDIADAMLDEYVKMYRTMTCDGMLTKQIEKQQSIIESVHRKKRKLLQLVTDDNITDRDFKEMTAQCNEELDTAEKELADLMASQDSSEDFRKHMEKIRKVLRDAEKSADKGEISKEFVDTYIDKIFATPIDDNTIQLEIRIFTGDTTSKYLQKLKRRGTSANTSSSENVIPDNRTDSNNSDVSMGHTFKKMVEKYENDIKSSK
ncbi:MAG: recombinase zinc beta ribbon domain-containing protein [Firmicutes bacterium]|nr:recombinase zinc beta ribbon domain-containing protein [Bacillota bacterium]